MAGFKPYFRPNQKWVCGWAAMGKACPRGPGAKGTCKKQFECEPSPTPGGFKCSRPPQFGGKCSVGPNPDGSCNNSIPRCSPKRSLREKRGLLVVCVSAISLGVVFLQLGKSKLDVDFINPGKISSRHGSVAHDCTSCHSNLNTTLAGIFSSATHPRANSSECLNCHKMDQNALQAHNLDEMAMNSIRAQHGGQAIVEMEKISCTTCHKEHRGADADISSLTNRQCQTCHTKQFNSFSDGHAEFAENYPFQRRTHILFDHTTHFAQHIPESGLKNISCQTCHETDSRGSLMVSTGFEKACATCHGNQIAGVDQTEKGVVFFRLPSLDVASLKAKNSNIGEWPTDTDGELTGFQRAFLTSNPELTTAFQQVAELDLSDLSEASREELLAVNQIVWGLKQLLFQLGNDQGGELSQRLIRIAGTKLDGVRLANLKSGFNVEVFRSAGRAWFPNLRRELEQFKQGVIPPTKLFTVSDSSDEGDEARQDSGGWYRATVDFTVRYRPAGHGDKFLYSWLNLASEKYAVDFAKKLFSQMGARSGTPGMCLSCHSVDALPTGAVRINWHGLRSDNVEKSFTKFQHKAHFALLNDQGCYRCHELNKEAAYDVAYEGFDPAKFASNFAPIKKATCVECHSEDNVGQDCQSCHNYHVGAFHSMQEQMDTIETKLLNESGSEPETEPKGDSETESETEAATEAESSN